MYSLNEIKQKLGVEKYSFDALFDYYTFLENTPCSCLPGTYTESHHILPRSIFPFLSKDPNNLIDLLPGGHLKAHYYLALVFPECREVQVAFYLMTNYKRYASNTAKEELKQFEKVYIESRDYVRKLNSQRVKSKVIVKNEDGTLLLVDNTDPRWLSGDLKPAATGTAYTEGFQWRFDSIGNRVFLPPNDPRLVSKEFTTEIPPTYSHFTKGKIIAYTKEGTRCILQDKNDNRLHSGELTLTYPKTHKTKGTVGAKDEKGKLHFVFPNDNRLGVSLTLVKQPKKQLCRKFAPNKGKICTHDSLGIIHYVDKNDSRLVSGELILGLPEKTRLKMKKSTTNRIKQL